MAFSRINASAATLTKNRTEGSVVPASGMCVTCVDGCIGMCEIGKSAYRGHEVIYPQPFGVITTAAEKNYPVDYSHFNIMGTVVGAHGIEADSDRAIFPEVRLEVALGTKGELKFRYPWIISGIGSTDIAKNNWEGLAIGSALSGTGLTIGENVVGMDPDARIEKGRVVDALALGAPFVKLVGMARAPLAAAMVGKTIGRAIENGQIPVYIERFGHSKEDIFVTASTLRKELGEEAFQKIPAGALGLYTYYERLAQGLRQLMAGSRKFSLEHLSRG